MQKSLIPSKLNRHENPLKSLFSQGHPQAKPCREVKISGAARQDHVAFWVAEVWRNKRLVGDTQVFTSPSQNKHSAFDQFAKMSRPKTKGTTMTRREFAREIRRTFERSQEDTIQYLTQEIKFLMSHLKRRPKPTLAEKAALARAAKAVDPLFLETTFNLFTPSTLNRWHQELIRRKWDYSRLKRERGRPRIARELEELIIKVSLENPNDGQRLIAEKLRKLGFDTNHETVQNVQKRNGISPSPDRVNKLTWMEFLDTHWEDLAATDFLSWEVLTPFGLITHYILFLVRHLDRKIHIAGVSTNPNQSWMLQVARNLTAPETGFLTTGMKLLHDRDTKYTAQFLRTLNEAGIKTVKVPIRSPKCNAHAETFVRSVKRECLSRMVITSEKQLREVLKDYAAYYNSERPHQGLGGHIPEPDQELYGENNQGKIARKKRLGGLLNTYFREKGKPKHRKAKPAA